MSSDGADRLARNRSLMRLICVYVQQREAEVAALGRSHPEDPNWLTNTGEGLVALAACFDRCDMLTGPLYDRLDYGRDGDPLV